jgi:hypothetical protein
MARRNQPYLPLYVDDFQTDERLIECSAESTGVYIRLMCLMHKSEEYGKILLKQKDKQNESKIINFANKLVKFFPYTIETIINSLTELINEGVIMLDGDSIIQKRMVRDCEISDKRSIAGGTRHEEEPTKDTFAEAKIQAKGKAKSQANSGIGIGIEIVNRLYSLYPNKCPVKNTSTGKGEKDKKKIGELLKTKSELEIETAINNYIADSRNGGRYIKNFSTFLNNMPDMIEEVKQENSSNMVYYRWKDDASGIRREILKEKADAYFANKKEGGYIAVILS